MGYVLFSSGLIFGFFFLLTIRRAKSSQSWPSTKGIIIGTSMEESYDDEGDFSGYIPHVHYEYEVKGEKFTSDDYGLSDKIMNKSKAQQFLAPFSEGQRVTVYYSPKHHNDAVLSTQSGIASYILVAVCAVLAAVGLYMILTG